MPELQQVGHRDPRAQNVIDLEGVGAGGLGLVVEEHERNLQSSEILVMQGADARGRDDDAVDAMLAQ